MAFCPEHPKWDQNPKFTPLSETTSIPTTFICRVPPPPLPGCLPETRIIVILNQNLFLTFVSSGKIPGLHEIPCTACHKHQHNNTNRNVHENADYVSIVKAFSWTIFGYLNFGVLFAVWSFFIIGSMSSAMFFHHFLDTFHQGRTNLSWLSRYSNSNVVLLQCPYKLELFESVGIKFFTGVKNYSLYFMSSC